jgi:hypothetical protein
MSSNAVALRDPQTQVAALQRGGSDELTDVQRLGNLLAASGYFSDVRDMAQAAVKVMAGKELGIPPIASMMGIHIIKGKVSLGANLIASRIRAHGYDFVHKQFDTTACVLSFMGRPDASGKRTLLGDSAFTMEDAKAAGLTGNETYKKFPRNMLFSRAISNGARWYTPEVFGGAPVYTPDELGATVDEHGDVVEQAEPTTTEQIHARQAVLDRELEKAKAAGIDVEKYAKSQAPAVPPEVAAMWKRMDEGKFPTLDVFGQLKDQCQQALGDEPGKAAYYSVLKANGVEKSDQFKSSKPAKKCARELWEAIQRAKETQAQHEFQADDSDLPEVLSAEVAG